MLNSVIVQQKNDKDQSKYHNLEEVEVERKYIIWMQHGVNFNTKDRIERKKPT